jgi:uncharacterized protein (DUF2267 family)
MNYRTIPPNNQPPKARDEMTNDTQFQQFAADVLEECEKESGYKLYTGVRADLPTLRDQMAMAALQGLLANGAPTMVIDVYECAAQAAYKHADAMLRARKKEG